MLKKIIIILLTAILVMSNISFADTNVFNSSFDNYDETNWRKADGYSNGSVFNCTWRKENVNFIDGNMILKIDNEKPTDLLPYSGGEYRTKKTYGYGKYSVKMKPAKNVGIVSSFFTYTGPSEGTPWDEIDIEFLGKDTTKVQFNYFTNGKSGAHEYLYDLGFDASQSFHTYSFLWLEESITWYVDDIEVYTVKENIPSHFGKIMMNMWPGKGVDSWLGTYDGNTDMQAIYDWIEFIPLSELSNQDIITAISVLPESFNAIEDEHTNLLTYFNNLKGIYDTGVNLTIISNHPNISDDGTLTYGENEVTDNIIIKVNKEYGMEQTKTIAVTVSPKKETHYDERFIDRGTCKGDKEWVITFNFEIDPQTISQNIFVAEDEIAIKKVDAKVYLDPENSRKVRVLAPTSGYINNKSYYLFINTDIEAKNSKGNLKIPVRMKFTINE